MCNKAPPPRWHGPAGRGALCYTRAYHIIVQESTLKVKEPPPREAKGLSGGSGAPACERKESRLCAAGVVSSVVVRPLEG